MTSRRRRMCDNGRAFWRSPVTYHAPLADIGFALKYGAGACAGDRPRPVRRSHAWTMSTRCWRKPAASPAKCSRRSTASATRLARRSRTAPSPRRRAGRRPIAAGAWRLERRHRAGANGAARRCRRSSTPLASKCGMRASIGFANGPMLTMAAIDALNAHGSDALKKTYLEKLVSGEWMGTMQLTEPQAGSDVGALRTRAERARRRHLSPQGPEDLHHLRRARFHRQHHPFRAGAVARCAARHARHFAVPGAEISAQRRRLARRAQRHSRPFGRAQARHPRLADLHDDPRRPRRRRRLSDRRGERRHGLHVHHDEPRAARRRPARRRHRRSAPRSRRWPTRASAGKAAPPA